MAHALEAVEGDETMLMALNKRRRLLRSIGGGGGPFLPAALLMLAVCAPIRADAAAVSPQAVDAKLKYCEVCHGASGRGFHGYFPIPRLAGQPVEYIENELKAFAEHKRVNRTSPGATNVMFNVGHVLSPAMIKALATKFHEFNPKPVAGAPTAHMAEGEKIFKAGIPSAKVPPCASCHGKDGKGNGPFPRLAGQIYTYVVAQLTNWSHERTEQNSEIMAPIAHELTKPQIEAVAAYVSDLP
jgi:cytochrome c553